MISYIRKFGVVEYVFFVAGFIGLLKQVIGYWNDTLEFSALNGAVLVVSVLMMAAPRFLVKAIKDRTPSIFKKK